MSHRQSDVTAVSSLLQLALSWPGSPPAQSPMPLVWDSYLYYLFLTYDQNPVICKKQIIHMESSPHQKNEVSIPLASSVT